ncbi:orotidine-5'-phosphate decarboxylase [Sulfurospirillum arcachonense]|uniref:orotidine-5'-phosphate decarboxylase n=1 Tax=Sulfurospirillum arcachonense TaxID=57666 RepID=UPI00046AB8B8|nr:orotidine-5'-phosphate decarboxylase [Sulfurospirillum arcachonense]
MKLCVALDLPNAKENLDLAKVLKSEDVWLKVGLRSYIRDGKPLLEELKAINPNFKLFLDLKVYDIPNTMADAAESMAGLGVDMFNVHASSGKKAMSMVMDRLCDIPNPPIVLAVTALTSFDEPSFQTVYNETIDKKAAQFAKDAYESGLNGVVCSVFESALIKSSTTQNFLTLTPGIRPFGEDAGDQQRVANLETAKNEMSDFIVVGRPIYQSNDPLGVTKRILENI